MKKQSAGILVYKHGNGGLEVFLTHPGGPFWAKKDKNAWSIPKGEFEADESPKEAAWREFKEETGMDVPKGDSLELGVFKVSSNKEAHVWAIEGDLDPKQVKSNSFEMEWPPKSGRMQTYDEVDKAAWFPAAKAREKMMKGQVQLLEALARQLKIDITTAPTADPATEKKSARSRATGDQQVSLF
jgi:predicted NUDIX family NTP pyrophosphohydrolase